MSSQWPGTISWSNDPNTVYWLTLSSDCATKLGEQVDGLYEWSFENGQPEDLALLCEDGREFLGSVSHEHDSWMWLTPVEYSNLCDEVPHLSSMFG